MKSNGIKRILFGCWLCLMAWSVQAGEVKFTATAPATVVSGEQFRLSYSLNQQGKDLRIPEISGFEILMGPSTSHSSSTQIVNGSVSHSMTVSYTYILMALQPGTYTIAPATISVEGTSYSSNALTIHVLPQDSSPTTASGGNGSSKTSSSSVASASAGGGKAVFVRTILSRSKVYEQEPLCVTYKLYVRGVDVRRLLDARFPEFKGFYVQDIELDPNRSMSLENYEGANYNTYVLKQSLLYPQHSGEIKLDPGSVQVLLQVATGNSRGRSFFDDFFDSYQEVRKDLVVPAAKVNVQALPAGAPAGFTGAVGQYSLSSDISATELKANEALTVKVKVSGNGNLKLLKMPTLTFPNDFEEYDPKTDSKVRVGASGSTGERTVEYLAIPRFGGNFEIPSATFAYFDPAAGQYKSLKTPIYQIKVEGSAEESPVISSHYNNKEQVRNLATDIRHIRSVQDLKPKHTSIAGSMEFWMGYWVPLLLFLFLLILLRKKARENADIALQKTRRANKEAVKRLKKAGKCLRVGDNRGFYEETMKALWWYLSDKLLIDGAALNKDNVHDQMLAHHASEELVKEFLDTLSDCEFARFSPSGQQTESMQELYQRSSDLIGKLDNVLK